MRNGAVEYEALQKAIREHPPACLGDGRFPVEPERLSAADTAEMRAICQSRW